jgi:hypothetical protein
MVLIILSFTGGRLSYGTDVFALIAQIALCIAATVMGINTFKKGEVTA